ncbi:hypothetical protein K435DRAFT_806957 [Dendrothele bispora CBS 962.96]|uniref:Uncharacterized protein n=1 Tax=Dendrothele bispora (strain CBS 962.96) TaxID=1314807 RepID=A0A4S8L681_DENBC|nr:hypothetical protein K435DRAFT_806957 [Dendrothele bispora CBS 962.96]
MIYISLYGAYLYAQLRSYRYVPISHSCCMESVQRSDRVGSRRWRQTFRTSSSRSSSSKTGSHRSHTRTPKSHKDPKSRKDPESQKPHKAHKPEKSQKKPQKPYQPYESKLRQSPELRATQKPRTTRPLTVHMDYTATTGYLEVVTGCLEVVTGCAEEVTGCTEEVMGCTEERSRTTQKRSQAVKKVMACAEEVMACAEVMDCAEEVTDYTEVVMALDRTKVTGYTRTQVAQKSRVIQSPEVFLRDKHKSMRGHHRKIPALGEEKGRGETVFRTAATTVFDTVTKPKLRRQCKPLDTVVGEESERRK